MPDLPRMVPLDQVDSQRWMGGLPRPSAPRKLATVGVDCGQIRDFSACIVAELLPKAHGPAGLDGPPPDALFGEAWEWTTFYRVLGLQRIAIGTSYPDVARRVNQLAQRLLDRDYIVHVIVDATGVGRGVTDLIREKIDARIHVTAVTITGGSKSDLSLIWRNEASVSKAWLVSRLQAILQAGRLAIPRGPDAATQTAVEELLDELRRFEIRVRKDSAEPEMGGFSTVHDDLCIGLCLACCVEHQSITYSPPIGRLPSPIL